jgi:hypothetical protein
MAVPVEITDEFVEPYGEFKNGYAAINKAQQEALREQKHVDIRSFVPDKPSAQVNMLFMDRLTMYYLDGEPATAWNSAIEYHPGEVVEKSSVKYVSIKVGTNHEPPNAEYWSKAGEPAGELSRYTKDTSPPAHVVVINNEGWTFGAVGPQSDRNNWNGISIVCAANVVTPSQSIITFNEH